jgi:hypothetical protein
LPDTGKAPPGNRGNQQPFPSKREYRQHETTGSISGTYKLYDLLDLSTMSGSVNINVDIQPGDNPAILRIAAQSGSIRVNVVSHNTVSHRFHLADSVSKRVFHSDIETQSGSISGSLIHGNGGRTSISTKSGNINVTLYTVGVSSSEKDSEILTSSASGHQRIVVKSDASSIGIPIRAIQASHTVVGSASINVDYPAEWEGTVHTQAVGSGSSRMSGRDLETQCQGGKECWGRRGDDAERAGRVDMVVSGSGSLKFSC